MASHISPVVLRQEIGRRIRLARHEAGLTIVEAAARLEISRSVLNRYETGEGTVSDELPTVTLRVLPATVISNDAMIGGFTILDFPAAGQPSIGYALHNLGEERQDKSEYVEPARVRFARLRSLALDPEASKALIERAAGELWSS